MSFWKSIVSGICEKSPLGFKGIQSGSYSLDMLIAFVLVYNIFSSNKLNLQSFVFSKLTLIF